MEKSTSSCPWEISSLLVNYDSSTMKAIITFEYKCPEDAHLEINAETHSPVLNDVSANCAGSGVTHTSKNHVPGHRFFVRLYDASNNNLMAMSAFTI